MCAAAVEVVLHNHHHFEEVCHLEISEEQATDGGRELQPHVEALDDRGLELARRRHRLGRFGVGVVGAFGGGGGLGAARAGRTFGGPQWKVASAPQPPLSLESFAVLAEGQVRRR